VRSRGGLHTFQRLEVRAQHPADSTDARRTSQVVAGETRQPKPFLERFERTVESSPPKSGSYRDLQIKLYCNAVSEIQVTCLRARCTTFEARREGYTSQGALEITAPGAPYCSDAAVASHFRVLAACPWLQSCAGF
jgi:hypothetical protein